MRVRHWLVLVSAVVTFALAGCGSGGWPAATPTPIPPTPTRLEQEYEASVDSWRERTQLTRGHDVLQRQGVRVTSPSSNRIGDNYEYLSACSDQYPVMGTEFGQYFLPEDAAEDTDFSFAVYIGLYVDLCFASEEDAVRAGYQRGPH